MTSTKFQFLFSISRPNINLDKWTFDEITWNQNVRFRGFRESRAFCGSINEKKLVCQRCKFCYQEMRRITMNFYDPRWLFTRKILQPKCSQLKQQVPNIIFGVENLFYDRYQQGRAHGYLPFHSHFWFIYLQQHAWFSICDNCERVHGLFKLFFLISPIRGDFNRWIGSWFIKMDKNTWRKILISMR